MAYCKNFFLQNHKMRRLLLSAKEVITSDALIFYPQKTQETEAIRNEQLHYRA